MGRVLALVLVLAACSMARNEPVPMAAVVAKAPAPSPPVTPVTPVAVAPVEPAPGIAFRSVAWSRDGKTIAVGVFHATVVIDASTQRELARVGESRGWHEVSFLPDGRLVTQGSHDTVPAHWRSVLWDARAGKLLHVFAAQAACASDTEVAWGCGADGTGVRARYQTWNRTLIAERWDGTSMQPAWTVTDGGSMYTVKMAVAPGGAVAVGGGHGYSMTETEPMLVHTNERTSQGDLRRYYYEDRPKGVGGGFVRIFRNGRLHCEKLGIGAKIISTAFSDDGESLAAGDSSGDVFVLSARCELKRTLRGAGEPAIVMAWGPGRVAAISENGLLRWWDLSSDQPVAAAVMSIH